MKNKLSKIETELSYLHMCVWSGGTFNKTYYEAYKKMVDRYTSLGIPIRDEHYVYLKRYEKEVLKEEQE